MDTENYLPLIYAFQGRLDHLGRIQGNVEPVKNSYFYCHEFAQVKGGVGLMKSNGYGLLQPVMGASDQVKIEDYAPSPVGMNVATSPELSGSGFTLSKIPDGLVSYLAVMEGKNCNQIFYDTMREVVENSNWKDVKLALYKIPFNKFRKPENNKEDKSYQEWYKELEQQGIPHIYGYIIPKFRSLICISSFKYEEIDTISVHCNKFKNGISKFASASTSYMGGISVFTLTNDDEHDLPKGIYDIKVTLTTEGTNFAGSWSNLVKTDNLYTYTLKEMVRFDIKNDLGEFSIVLIDPISIEETLLQQFPKEYAHLIKLAKKNSDEGNALAPNVPDKSVMDVVLKWSSAKLAAEYVNSTATFPLDTKKALMASASFPKAILQSMGIRDEDHPLMKFASTIESTGGAASAFTTLLEKLNEPDKQVKLNKAQLNQYFKPMFSPSSTKFSAKEIEQFEETLAGRLTRRLIKDKSSNIRSQTLTRSLAAVQTLGKVAGAAGAVTNWVDVGKKGHDVFFVHKPQLNTAKRDIKLVGSDYYYLTQLEEKKADPIICGVEFEFGKAVVRESYHENLLTTAKKMQAVIDDYQALPKELQVKPLVFEIAGHTCDIGSHKDNEVLSQNRADAVLQFFTNQGGIGASYINAIGYGETDPALENSDETNRKANRRVELNYSEFHALNAAPSREGIQSLERYRSASVLAQLKMDDASADAVQSLGMAAAGLLLFTPAAPVAALGLAGIEAVKQGYAAVKSLTNLVDSVFLDSILEQHELDKKQLLQVVKQSLSNAYLLEEYDEADDDQPFIRQLLDQFRVRSEAVNGLLYLLVLIGVKSDDSASAEALMESYQLEAYIENFILNDGWIYRPSASFWLRHQPDFSWTQTQLSPLDVPRCSAQRRRRGCSTHTFKRVALGELNYGLGTYWAHVAKVTQEHPHTLPYYGLDSDYRFVVPDEKNKTDGITAELNYGTRLPMLSRNAPTGYIKTDFKKLFPIHYLKASQLNDFMDQFRVNWGSLSKKDYEFIGVFRLKVIRDTDDFLSPLEPLPDNQSIAPEDWFNMTFDDFQTAGNAEVKKNGRIVDSYWEPVDPKPYTIKRSGRNQRRVWNDQAGVYHDTPICVVVIFRDSVQTHVPVIAQIQREDTVLTIKGPSFEGVATSLTEDDFQNFPSLKSRKDIWENKMGCMITPFYQHGKNRIDGLKPMAGKTAMDLKGIFSDDDKKAVAYYQAGYLRNMDYRIKVSLGTPSSPAKSADIIAPIWCEAKGNADAIESSPQSIYTTLKITQSAEYSALLNREFLASTAKTQASLTLFENSIVATPFIRIANDSGNWSDMVNALGSYERLQAVTRHCQGKPTLSKGAVGELKLEQFQWQNPVEFVFVFACKTLDKQNYRQAGLNWRSVACSVKMMSENSFADKEGPTLSGDLKYIGEVSFDGEHFDVRLDSSHDEDLFKLLQPYVKEVSHWHYRFIEPNDARRMFDYWQKDNGWKKYVYMSQMAPKYDTPKGIEQLGLRPFGARPWFGDYLEYTFQDFAAAGLKPSSFLTDTTAIRENHGFQFSEPPSYEINVPWAKGNPELAADYPPGSKEYKFLSSDTITENELEYWMEDQAKVVEFSVLNPQAIKRK